MKKKLKTKYLAGGPPQNSYFGMARDNTMAMSNLDSLSRGVAGSVSALNQSQEQAQVDSFKNVAQGAMSMVGKAKGMNAAKKGGFRYKFQTGGACPPGLAFDKASGQCLPDPNWVGSTPGLGVLAEEYLPGMQAAWEGEFQPTDFLAEQKDTGITKVEDIPGSILLKDEYLTDPNTINALQGTAPIVGNIAKQAKRAGRVTDLVEQGVPMASNKMNLTGALPGAGLVGAGLAAMATNMTSDKNAATFTRGEKAGTYASGIISGAASGASKFGLLGAVGGGIMGAFGAKKAAREAENVAKGIRREEEALGVASREASKNSWQGQESGFAYKGSTNMNMLGTGARRMKSGGVERVPGGLIVPIKGTNAVEYIGNKHSESKIDGVSGIHIDKDTEVEHKETKQPVMMAKSGGANSSKGKMRDYFFSAYLKLGGKSFAQRHKEILAGGGSKTKIQALVQKLAQQQEAVANQNGEKDRSPSTIAPPKKINAYGGIHKYQTAGEKEEETKDETAATPETFYEFPVENAGDETLYYNGIALKATPSLDYNGNPIESQFSTPATDVGDPNKRYMRPGISRPERSGVGRKLDTNSGPWSLVDKIGGRGVFRRGNQTVGSSDVYESYDPTDTPDSERSVRRHSYLENRYPAPGDEMRESDYSKLAPIKPLDGVKPETTVNADGSVSVSGVQVNDPIREIGPDGTEIFVVYDDNGVAIGKSSVRSVAKSKAQNELIARESKKAKAAAEPDESSYGQNSQSLDDMVEMDDGSYVTKDQYEKSISGVKPAATESKSNNFDTSKVLLEELGYMKGKELDEKMSDGRTKRQHLEDKLKSGDKKKIEEANYEMSLLGANDETFENSTPEQSANAQSNADASNVTVRDQNQANAQAPSGQQSVAPGGGTNNAGQAAADAAAKAGTQDATATATSKEGTPVTSSTTTTSKSGTATTGNTGAPADKRAKLLEETQPIAAWEKPAQTKDKLGSTPRESIKSGIWSGDNYDKEWKPLVEETMADADLAKKVYDYLTTYQGPSDEVAAVKKRITDDPTTSIKSIIENATDGDVGPFHNAVLNAIKSVQPKTTPTITNTEKEKEKEEEKEVKTEKEPCPEGTFRSQSGECLPIPKNITTKSYWSKTAGLSQYLAPVWALLNPYEKTRGMAGVPTASTGPNPRVNLNQERATEREENIAMTNMVRNQSGIQAAIGQSFNNKQNASMLKIAQQEGNINKALIADEQDRAAKVSMFNVQNEVERQKFNRALAKEENQYAREDKLAALQQIGLVTAGNYRDMKMYEATERLADAMQIGGEYTRRKFYEALKDDPAFKGMSDLTIKEFANAYYNLTERPYERTNANESTRNVQKLGGTRRYTSRLGELTKRKSLKFSK